MLDLLMVAITLLFFVAALGYIRFCERVEERVNGRS